MSQSTVQPVVAPALEVLGGSRFRLSYHYLPPLFFSFILLVGHLFYGILESFERTGLAIAVALITELGARSPADGQAPRGRRP
jgi:hypothetical protein